MKNPGKNFLLSVGSLGGVIGLVLLFKTMKRSHPTKRVKHPGKIHPDGQLEGVFINFAPENPQDDHIRNPVNVYPWDPGFTFSKDSLEVFTPSDTIAEVKRSFPVVSTMTPEKRARLELAMEKDLTMKFRKELKNPDIKVTVMYSIHRNTGFDGNGAGHELHIDFHVDEDAQRCYRLLAERADHGMKIDLTKHELVDVVNIWLPLDKKVQGYPLVFVKPSTVYQKPQDFSRIIKKSRLLGFGKSLVSWHEGQVFYYKPDMGFGECYLFRATTFVDEDKLPIRGKRGTPHSAVCFPELEGERTNGVRQDWEGRFLVYK